MTTGPNATGGVGALAPLVVEGQGAGWQDSQSLWGALPDRSVLTVHVHASVEPDVMVRGGLER